MLRLILIIQILYYLCLVQSDTKVNKVSQVRQLLDCPVGKFFNSNSGACQDCHISCQSCSGPTSTDCTSCSLSNKYIPKLGMCKNDCDASQYIPALNICLDCHPNCLNCNGGSYDACTQCKAGFFFTQALSLCSESCPLGYYSDGASKCLPCLPQCESCSSGSSCSTCPLTKLSKNTDCVDTCGDGFYQGGTMCLACHNSCKTCDGPREIDCLSCELPKRKLFDRDECAYPCPDGYYDDYPYCKPCHSFCATCSGPLRNNCLSCRSISHYVPSTHECIASCPAGFYSTSVNCQKCSDQCKTCIGGATNHCTSCHTGQKLVADKRTCVDYCPSTRYLDTPYSCIPCHSKCETCSGLSSNNCLTCPQGTFYNSVLTTCETQCSEGYYEDNGQCKKCFQLCATCSGSANNCTSCHQPDLLTPSTGMCVTSCLPGFFQDDSTSPSTCLACHPTCETCLSPSQQACLTCASSAKYQPDSKMCVESCTSGYYAASSLCLKCHQSCAECDGSSQYHCTLCSDNQYLVQEMRSCSASCEPSYFIDGSDCKKCHRSCATCDGALETNCLTCPEFLHYYEEEKRCYGACPSGSVLIDGRCESKLSLSVECHHGCKECSGTESAHCTSCREGDLLVPNQGCLPSCAPGYFQIFGECWKCHETCATCNGSQDTNCKSCRSPLFFIPDQNRCVPTCEPGTYRSGSECKPCYGECATCDGPYQSNCLSCISNYYKISNKKECVLECPEGYFSDIQTVGQEDIKVCNLCHSNCKTCDGPLSTDCLTCQDKIYYPTQKTCVGACQPGTYHSASTCLECNEECATCDGPYSNDCLTCPEGKILKTSLGYCVDNCAPGQYKEANVCRVCHSDCLTCNGRDPDNCLSCKAGQFYLPDSHICAAVCPDGAFGMQGLCLSCHNSCLTCNGPNKNNCLSCPLHLYFNSAQHTCTDTCAEGFYSEGRLCLPCDETCKTCTGYGPSRCSSCADSRIFDVDANLCVTDCGLRRYSYARKCENCHPSCLTCEGGYAHNCLSCEASLLFTADFKTCVSECQAGYYQHQQSCLRCHSECQTCQGLSSRDCTSCRPGMKYVSTSNTCVSSCPSHYYQIQQLCKPCNPFCTQCTGSGESDCLACIPNFYLFQSQCKVCPLAISMLQGEELMAAMAQNCDLQITKDDQVLDMLETEVIQKYNSCVPNWCQIQEFQTLIDASTNIMMSHSASYFRHSSLKQTQVKKLISLSEDTQITLDQGYSKGAKITVILPASLSEAWSQLDSVTFVSSVWRQGMFDYQDFGGFECPVIALSLASKGSILEVKNLQDPIILTLQVNGPSPSVSFSGAYWTGVQWSKRNVATQVEGYKIIIRTKHLSSFTLINDISQGLTLNPPEQGEVLIQSGSVFLALFFLLSLISVMCDVATCKHEYYPHLRQVKQFRKSSNLQQRHPSLFYFIFKYSLLYNMPFVSLFSYRDKAVHTWARTLWLGGQLCTAYIASFLVFYNKVKIGSTQGSIALLSLFLSILFVPTSCLFCMLKRSRFSRKNNKAIAPLASPKSSDLQLRDDRHSPNREGELDLIGPVKKEQKSKPTLQSKICFALFLLIIITEWIAALVITITTLEQLYYTHTDIYRNTLLTTLIALFLGMVLSFFKSLIATAIAKNYRRVAIEHLKSMNQPILVQLFVDELTAMLHQDFVSAIKEIELRDLQLGLDRRETIKIKRFAAESATSAERTHKRQFSGQKRPIPPIKIINKLTVNAGGYKPAKPKSDKKPPFI